MIVIRSGHINVFFDVDDTLIEWVNANDERVEKEFNKTVKVPLYDGNVYCFFPITENIDYLKRVKMDGGTVVVWSQGGSDWCESVVNALGLSEYVDVCVTKPDRYVDDLECTMFMRGWIVRASDKNSTEYLDYD